MELSVYDKITSIAEAEWESLVDGEATPFLRWRFLEALESSGCASAARGWQPCHLVLRRERDIVAAAPAYIKQDSDGDFARDWGWADAAMRAGIPYYPKLCLTVPFSPCTGRRILVAPGEDRAAAVEALVAGARALADKLALASVHVLFPRQDEALAWEAAGMARRVSYQYHWRNDGYKSFDEFLLRFDSKRRNQAKREIASLAQHRLRLRTLRGPELSAAPKKWADLAYELHKNTVDKLMWGRRFINRAFYRRVVERMPENLEVVVAEHEDDGRVVAGAFNVASATRLYGRYWGCFEDFRFLHFNVCMYHSIRECIHRGVVAFEGGAGGEHKIPRGFLPAETFSAHLFLDARLDAPLRDHIAREADERARALQYFREHTPILRRADPEANPDGGSAAARSLPDKKTAAT